MRIRIIGAMRADLPPVGPDKNAGKPSLDVVLRRPIISVCRDFPLIKFSDIGRVCLASALKKAWARGTSLRCNRNARLSQDCDKDSHASGNGYCGIMAVAIIALEALLLDLSGVTRDHAAGYVANPTTPLAKMPFGAV